MLWKLIASSAIVVGTGSACIAESETPIWNGPDPAHADTDHQLPPFVAKGPPISARANQWSWVDFPESLCRDGSTSGILVNLRPDSGDLMVALQGGGACFDALSCQLNAARASRAAPASAGIFDRNNAANPVRDWNFVYVPYCTGDVHAGTKRDGKVANVSGSHQFVGRANMEAFLHRIVPTFPGVGRVLLTGTSAGGFGTAASAVLLQRAFPSVKVMTVDDSGPPLSGDYLAPCLQAKWRDTWGLERSLLADCGSHCPDRDDFVFDYAQYWAKLYRDRNSGIIQSTEDTVIRAFFGPGTLACRGSMLTPLLPRRFRDGLAEFRESIGDHERFTTYYPESRQHTWLFGDSFYTARAGSLSLLTWFTNIVENRTNRNAGP